MSPRHRECDLIMGKVEMCLQAEEKNPNHFDTETVNRVMRWKEATDSEGNTYYYHDETKEVRWDKPLFYDEVREVLGARDVEEQTTFAVTFQEVHEQTISIDQIAEDEEDVVRDVVKPTVSAVFSR